MRRPLVHWSVLSGASMASALGCGRLGFEPLGQAVDRAPTRPSSDGEDVDINLLAADTLEVWFGTTRDTEHRPLVLPRDEWLCLAARIDIDDTAGGIDVQLGDAHLVASGQDTLPDQGIDEIRVGIDWSSPAQVPAEVHLDDVFVSDEPLLGCP